MAFRFLCLLLALLAPCAWAPAQQTPNVQGALKQLNDSFANVFEKVAPSVVIIEADRSTPRPLPGLPQGFDFFLDEPNTPSPRMPANIGSGFIIKPDGYILTNNHVIEGTDEITVRLRDGRQFPAALVASDDRTDLAVLKIEATSLPVADLGDSDHIRVGEFAFAIGTPMELPYTFTVGVISAKNRNLSLSGNYDEFIQTDASINPGNSGGPLCDIEGRVIGINTLINGMNRGLGFAIPINIAKNVADQLINTGYVRRPWLGISISSLSSFKETQEFKKLFTTLAGGVVVCGIEPNAPAQSSDLRAGDVILKVDGVQVLEAIDLQKQILSKKIGQNVDLEVWRKGRIFKVAATTGERPDNYLRASMQRRRSPSAPNPPSQSHGTTPDSPGVSVSDISPEALHKFGIQRQETGGVVVTKVEPFSAAAVAGLEPGDIITEAGGRPILSKKDFSEILKSLDPERGLLLLLERQGRRAFAILKPQ